MASLIEYSQDLSNAEPPPLLPPGPYPAEIVGAIAKVSQTDGHKFLQLSVRIHSESYPADYVDGDPDGTDLQYNFIRIEDSPRGRHTMRRFLEKVGAPLTRDVDPDSLIGRTMTVEITHRHNDFMDEMQLNIARILAP